jgi:hypothetical protein
MKIAYTNIEKTNQKIAALKAAVQCAKEQHKATELRSNKKLRLALGDALLDHLAVADVFSAAKSICTYLPQAHQAALQKLMKEAVI